jgi:cytochrome bd-type quinol oxidase subunit 2
MELILTPTMTIILLSTLVCLWIVLWAYVLYECRSKEHNRHHRTFWTYAVMLGTFLGAACYLVYRRPRRIAEWGE